MTETREPVVVILAAHGDRGGATPNAALRAQADAVGMLTELPILPGLLKGDPSIESALESARAHGAARIIVYPMFMADGYFVHKLRERIAAVALTPSPDILTPLGLDPALPDILVEEAATMAEALGISPNFSPKGSGARRPGAGAAHAEPPRAHEPKVAGLRGETWNSGPQGQGAKRPAASAAPSRSAHGRVSDKMAGPRGETWNSGPQGQGAKRPAASAAPSRSAHGRVSDKMADREGFEPQSSRLLIVGHGSKLGPASASATRKAAARAAIARRFASVTTAFLEEEPFLEDALRTSAATPTVVAGFFFGDGLHAGEDVPDAIAETGANARYTGAIGNSPAVAPLIAAALRNAINRRDG